MAKTKKEEQHLDERSDADITILAKKLKIPLLDHKIPTLKSMIRLKWKKAGIKELAIAGLIKSPAKKKLKTIKENYSFNRRFSSEEMKTKSFQLSDACIRRNTLGDELKAIKKEYGGKIDAETAKINELASELQKGSENVLKTCDVLYDYDKATKIFSYEGTEVGREKMTKADYQLKANFE